MNKATLNDIMELNVFTSRMIDNNKGLTNRTYRQISEYINNIGEKIRTIKNFLRLKDTEWSLDLAYSGIEFGKNEFYKQLRASKSEYKPYYKILNDLLFLHKGMDKYREQKYMGAFVNIERAKKILAEINNKVEDTCADIEVSDLIECARVLDDIITSASYDIQEI